MERRAGLALRVAAPWLAVLVFWIGLGNAWLTMLAYHAMILVLSWRELPRLLRGWDARIAALVVPPCALAGPLTWLLLPVMASDLGVGTRLARVGLEGWSLALMVPYYGLVHGPLEEAHWGPLRGRGWWAHLAFAGYHALVLATLVAPGWAAASVATLLVASLTWRWAERRTRGGLLVPAAAHLVADLGIVVAAAARAA